jgi:hypothetical protein
MLNNNDFTALERRLWREGNPLADELASTRDELRALTSQINVVVTKYSKFINELADADDIEFYRQWDDLADKIDDLRFLLANDQQEG